MMIMLRPSGQVEDLFNFVVAGLDVDCNKILTSREELVKCFYSITKRTDIVFGNLVWISKYRPNILHGYKPKSGQSVYCRRCGSLPYSSGRPGNEFQHTGFGEVSVIN